MSKIDSKLQEHKGVGNLCFDNWKGRAVLVLDPCNSKTLYHLKKRNFVNVVMVDAPFKKRLKYYCELYKKQMDLAAFEQFSNKDLEYQTEDFRKCLEFVRIRVYNDKDLNQLTNFVDKNIK